MDILLTEQQLLKLKGLLEQNVIINQLNEQRMAGFLSPINMIGAYHKVTYDTPIHRYKTFWNGTIDIPQDSENVQLYSNDTQIGAGFADKDENGAPKMTEDGQHYIDKQGYQLPSEMYFHLIFAEGTLKSFVTKKDGRKYSVWCRWDITANPAVYKPYPAYGYKISEGQPEWYNPNNYIETSILTDVGHWFEEHWVDLLIIVVATLVGMFAGWAALGILGTELAGATAFSIVGWAPTYQAVAAIIGEAAIWIPRGIYQIANGKTGAGVMDLIFGLILPVAHGIGIAKWGADYAVVESTASKIAGKSTEEIGELMEKSFEEGGFSTAERNYYKEVSQASKETITDITKKVIGEAETKIKAAGKINPKGTLNEIIVKANKSIRRSSVGGYLRKKWYTWVPTMLAHDLPFLALMEKIEAKFGLVDKVTAEEMSKKYIEDPEKTVTSVTEGLKQSNNLEDLKSHVQKEWGSFDTKNAKVDTIDNKVNADVHKLDSLFNDVTLKNTKH